MIESLKNADLLGKRILKEILDGELTLLKLSKFGWTSTLVGSMTLSGVGFLKKSL